jgi:hypothetical protein
MYDRRWLRCQPRAKDQQWAVSLISSNTPIADFLWSLKMIAFLWFQRQQSVRIDIVWPFLSPLGVVWANQSSMSSWCSHPDCLNFSHKLHQVPDRPGARVPSSRQTGRKGSLYTGRKSSCSPNHVVIGAPQSTTFLAIVARGRICIWVEPILLRSMLN